MNLTPTELERLLLFNAAEFARRHLTLGIRLSHPEAVALIADEMLLAARRGLAYADIVEQAGQRLTTDDVEPGVASMIPMISVEGNFEQGTKLLVVFDPIGPGRDAAAPPDAPADADVVPGEILVADDELELNAGRPSVTLDVVNTGDRDIQVRSHAHFYEVNRALRFDRAQAYGMRLDQPSGGGVRFEPGMTRTVTLVAMAGERIVRGQAGLVDGPLDASGAREAARQRARDRAYPGD